MTKEKEFLAKKRKTEYASDSDRFRWELEYIINKDEYDLLNRFLRWKNNNI